MPLQADLLWLVLASLALVDYFRRHLLMSENNSVIWWGAALARRTVLVQPWQVKLPGEALPSRAVWYRHI